MMHSNSRFCTASLFYAPRNAKFQAVGPGKLPLSVGLDTCHTSCIIGSTNYLCPVEVQTIQELQEFCDDPIIVATEFKILAESIMTKYGYAAMPSTLEQAIELYFLLIHEIDQYL